MIHIIKKEFVNSKTSDSNILHVMTSLTDTEPENEGIETASIVYAFAGLFPVGMAVSEPQNLLIQILVQDFMKWFHEIAESAMIIWTRSYNLAY